MFAINYGAAADLAGHVEKLVGGRGAFEVDERTNYLIVEATPNSLVRVEAVLKLDIKNDQVLIEARMVEASTSFVRSLRCAVAALLPMAPATGVLCRLPFPNAITGNGGAVDSASFRGALPEQHALCGQPPLKRGDRCARRSLGQQVTP